MGGAAVLPPHQRMMLGRGDELKERRHVSARHLPQSPVGIRECHGSGASEDCGKYDGCGRQIDREVQKNASQECRTERVNMGQHVVLPVVCGSPWVGYWAYMG
jgi:hypothetical protein